MPIKIKNIFLFLFVLLFYPIAAYAASFDVKAVPVLDTININEPAKFNFEITNNLNTRQEFRIYTLDYPFWDIRTDPITNPITLTVMPKSTESIEILIDPLHVPQAGAYAVNIYVQSKSTDQKLIVPVEIGIKSTETLIGGYVPTVITSISIPEKIDPREEIPIKINLNNQNIIDYPDMIIKIESSLINDDIPYELGPKEEKTLMITKDVNPFTAPQKDKFVVSIFKGERLIVSPIAKTIEITGYGILDEVQTKKGFLRTRKEFLFTSNDENYEGEARVETTFFKALFTSTSPRAKSIAENGKRYFVWHISLENTNSLKITVTENFLPLLIITILIMVLVGLYYLFRSPLTIRKEAQSIKKRDGGISELKVVLHLRNRGSSPLKDIDLTESVPHLVHVEKEVSIGALHPEKILRHETRGTIIKWKLNSLNPNEERVLAYKIGARLPILGSLTLSAAGAKFNCDNKVLIASSNRLNVEV